MSGALTYNPFVYTARERHVASGLYYYRARWYDPQLGRFITQDPIGHLGGVNLYVYVASDPVNWIDPLGWLGWCQVASILAPPILTGGLAYKYPIVGFVVSLTEAAGAAYLWIEEYRYQESRGRLLEQLARADYLTADEKKVYASGVPLVSASGYRAAQLTASAGIGFRVSAARFRR